MVYLSDPVTKVKGIGTSRAQLLKKLNIYTIADLLTHFPREYTDARMILRVADLQEEEKASVKVRILENPRIFRKKGYTIVTAQAGDETGMLTAVWFNQPYMTKSVHQGEWYILHGKVRRQYGKIEIVSPTCTQTSADSSCEGRMEPQYALTAGLSVKVLRGMIHEALDETEGQWEEYLTEAQRHAWGLVEEGYAMRHVHEPESPEDARHSRDRLVFDELFTMLAALLKIRNRMDSQKKGFQLPVCHEERLLRQLPYTLTEDQKKVWGTIRQDLMSPHPMNRLVQGDVGSGKTVIAMLALLHAADNGMQGALMAPTEVLARQHYEEAKRYLGPLGISIGYLGGSLPAAEKKEIQARIASGELQIITGTHALFQESVQFQKLGVVITDEQHRFGVRQRMALSEKSTAPNVLVMTATPIPRTLALVYYGDMDISTIHTMPEGRRPVRTFHVNSSYNERLYAFMRKQTGEGHQVYIICPLVEESEAEPSEEETVKLTAAVSYHAYLSEKVFPDLRVGLLHGRMKPGEKDAAMEAFVSGDTQILVSTTVVEVGVNVPNATLMVIENAERFGLAQLHQLRGRVGRGQAESCCVLKSDVRSREVKERLSVLCNSSDGFYIAEQDMKLRGTGDLFGLKQSGLPDFKIADLYQDTKTLEKAQEAVRLVYAKDPRLEDASSAGIKKRIQQYIHDQQAVQTL